MNHNNIVIVTTFWLECSNYLWHPVGGLYQKYQAIKPKPTNKAELKTVLETIWADLPQEPIDRAVLQFKKRLQACVAADGGHFEHQQL